MLKIKLLILMALFAFTALFGIPPAQKRILVYTKNGAGYIHDNIKASVEALKKI